MNLYKNIVTFSREGIGRLSLCTCKTPLERNRIGGRVRVGRTVVNSHSGDHENCCLLGYDAVIL